MNRLTANGQTLTVLGEPVTVSTQIWTPEPIIGGRMIVGGMPATVLGDNLIINTQVWTVDPTFGAGPVTPAPPINAAPPISSTPPVNTPPVVSALPPVNTAPPAITGTVQQGQTLTASTGSWSASPTYSYQWLRAGVAIPGATSAAYILVGADVGNAITVQIIATNSAGSANRTSATTAAVTTPPVVAPPSTGGSTGDTGQSGGSAPVPTNAITMTVTAPSTMTVGTASTVTVTGGSGGLDPSKTFTPSAPGAGTFSPLNRAGNGTTPLVFAFTPSAAGTGSFSASSPGVTATPSGSVTISAAAAALAVTGITLSPSTGTANSATGTVIGTLTATTNTGDALINPIFAAVDTAGGDFQVLSKNQAAFLPSNVPAGNYTPTFRVLSADNLCAPSQAFPVPIKVNAATSTQPVAVADAYPMTSFPGVAGSPTTGLQAMDKNSTGATVDGKGDLQVPSYGNAAFIAAGEHGDGVDTITYASGSVKSFALMSYMDAGQVIFRVPNSGTSIGISVQIPNHDQYVGPFTLPADILTAATVGINVSNNGKTYTFQMNGADTAATFTSDILSGTGYLGLGTNTPNQPAASISRIDTSRLPKPATQFSMIIAPAVASPTTQRTLTLVPTNGPWPSNEKVTLSASSTIGVTLAATSLNPPAGSRNGVSTTLVGTTAAIGAIKGQGTVITAPGSATYLCVADKIDLAVAPASVYVNQTLILTAAPSNGLIWASNESLTAALASVGGTVASPTKQPVAGTRIPVEWVVTLTGTGTGTLNVTGVVASSTGACAVTAINRAPTSLALGLSNAKAVAIAAGTSITTGHLFAPGDVPAGSRVKAMTGSTAVQVQQDEESYWLGDGSLKFAVLTPKLPLSVAARGSTGSIAPLTLSSEVGTPNRTATFTLADYLAANDHKLAFRGLDATGYDFNVSANDIVANGTASPWDAGAIALTSAAAAGATSIIVADASHISVGQTVSADGKIQGVLVSAISGSTITLSAGLPGAVASGGKLFFNTPICGWKPLGAGPNARRWHFWSFLKASTGSQSGKYHAQVRADLYITAYGVNGPFEIDGEVEISNSTGDHPAGVIGRDSVAHRLVCASVALLNGTRTVYQFGGSGDSAGRVIPLTSSAFNTSNKTISTPPLTWLYPGHGFVLTTTGTMPSGLTANTAYWLNSGNSIRKDRINAGGAHDPGTPYETFSDQGSGAFSLIPTFAVFPAAAAALAQFDTTPMYDAGTSGATQARVLPIYDREYLLKRSKGGLPYDTSQTTYARTSGQIWDRGLITTVENYSPGQEQIWSSPWNISQYGDDPGDERVGPISNSEARICYQQDDLFNDTLINSGALRFSDYTHWFKNIRSGLSVAPNLGHAKDGVQYPGLGPVDNEFSITTGSRAPYIVRPGTADDSGHVSAYGPPIDMSHMPALGYLPYIRTGRRIFLDKMLQLACAGVALLYNTTTTVNGVVYPHCIAADNSQQMRGIAWQMRLLSNCEHVMAANDVLLPFIRDQLNDSGLYLDAYFGIGGGIDPRFLLSGWWCVDGGRDQGEQILYMHQFVMVVYGQIAWRDLDEGQRPGFRHFVSDFGRRNTMDLFDHDQGGGYWAGPTGTPVNGPYGGSVWMSSNRVGNGGAHVGAYQSPGETWVGNGVTDPDQPGWASGFYQGDSSYPFDTDCYTTINLAAIGMQSLVGVPKAQVMYDRLLARINASNPIKWGSNSNQHYDNNTPQSYIPWCIASRTSPAGTG